MFNPVKKINRKIIVIVFLITGLFVSNFPVLAFPESPSYSPMQNDFGDGDNVGYYIDDFGDSVGASSLFNIEINENNDSLAKILNFEGIMGPVQEYDFEVIYPDDLSREYDFEDGNLAVGWITSGDGNWFTTQPGYNSNWSARCPEGMSFMESADLYRTDFTPGSTITFDWKTQGGAFDCLELYDNDIYQFKICGNNDWQPKQYTAQSNNIKWRYNGAGSGGWLDNVREYSKGLQGWITSGDGNWFTTQPGYTGFWSVRSPEGMGFMDEADLYRTDFTPGNTITFDWKTQGGAFDCLELYDNDIYQFKICGDNDWQPKQYTAQSNNIKWRYGGTGSGGWLDGVNWETGSDDFEILDPGDVYLNYNFESTLDSEILFSDDFEIGDTATGEMKSIEIKPVPGASISKLLGWESFDIKENIYADTDISYSILDASGNVIDNIRPYGQSVDGTNLVSSFDLGFGETHYIDPNLYPSIRIKANFKTGTSATTPSLDYWAVTYLVDLMPPYVNIKKNISGNCGDSEYAEEILGGEVVTLCSTAYDQNPNQSGLSSHTIKYRANSGAWQSPTQGGSVGSRQIAIGPFAEGDFVEYKAETLDGVSNATETEIGSFTVGASIVVDCGLRGYDNSVVKFACEPLGTLTSPLRINKNGSIYGVILVDESDPMASDLKIKTSAGIKYIKKFE